MPEEVSPQLVKLEETDAGILDGNVDVAADAVDVGNDNGEVMVGVVFGYDAVGADDGVVVVFAVVAAVAVAVAAVVAAAAAAAEGGCIADADLEGENGFETMKTQNLLV